MAVATSLAQETISLFRQATLANRTTPGLRGHVVEVPTDMGAELIVTADMHGDRLNFEQTIHIANLEEHPRRHLVLQEVCHGGPTYPDDGGCMSHLLLEDVARLKVQFHDQVHFLLSNHELAEATDFPIAKGGRLLNTHFRVGLCAMYGDAADDVHEAIQAFLLSCPLALRVSDQIFLSHSLPSRCDTAPPRPAIWTEAWTADDMGPGGDVFRTVWGRDYRRENAHAFARAVGAQLLIHGHEPCPVGYHVPNDLQLIIDTSGPQACYLHVPLDQPITHGTLLRSVKRLHG